MTTDRELLEFAAKAAGLGVDFNCTQWGKFWAGQSVGFWNPLTDDGDAFRLAALLGINTRYFWTHISATRAERSVLAQKVGFPEIREAGEDIAPVTRLAIVRAAAAIGKAVP